MIGNMEKSKQLWFLLNNIDRSDISVFRSIAIDKEQYPFFYLLNWNELLNEDEQRKVSLQSLFRRNYKMSIEGTDYIKLSVENSMVIESNDEISQDKIIDQFLENAPIITKMKKSDDFELGAEVDYSNQQFNYPVSETFAKILTKQGKYTLAKEVFEQLSLKFPEKKTYFATLINELNEKTQNL